MGRWTASLRPPEPVPLCQSACETDQAYETDFQSHDRPAFSALPSARRVGHPSLTILGGDPPPFCDGEFSKFLHERPCTPGPETCRVDAWRAAAIASRRIPGSRSSDSGSGASPLI